MNELTRVAHEAMRARLLAELRATGWNMTHTSRRLGLGHPSNVVRAIKRLGLEDVWRAYREAQALGALPAGRGIAR